MTDTQTLLIACIATVIYPFAFMVAFDRFIAWTEKLPVGTTMRVTRRRAAPRPLRGLAAEPTLLPRTLSETFRPVTTPDAAIPALIDSLDRIPSTPLVASA